MESERRLSSRRTYVPSTYLVLLNPADLTTFDSYRDSLTAELAEALHAHARSHGYTLTARPRVVLEAAPGVSPGEVVVRVQPVQPPRQEAERARRQPTNDPAPQPAKSAVVERSAPPVADDDRAPAAQSSNNGMPRAVLVVRAPGQLPRRVPVLSPTVRVGRATDNDVVLADDRVSRHHGQFGVRLGTLIYTDLGSRNGSFLNGSAVTEIALGPGDVLQMGGSTLAIEQGD
jgi:pSer/pThr/pTyr-binding forkhead associated (FHA) protein